MTVVADTPPPLYPPACLGVIGGGQLGRMFVQSAQKMGYRTIVLTPDPSAPAAQVAHEVVVGSDHHLETLKAFAAQAEAATVEFENVSAPALRWLRQRMPVRPGWRTVWVSQNRLREKRFLSTHHFPHAPWAPLTRPSDLERVRQLHQFPAILKTASSGYDGKGQVRVDDPARLEAAWTTLHHAPCVLEQLVDFAEELSVVTVRAVDGSSASYPVALNRHKRHILDSTVIPAPVGPKVTQEAKELARAIAAALGNVGVLTVEFFLTTQGELLVNELAPRPHNSGHWTIEGASCSQFDQQVRALAGLPLGDDQPLTSAAMVNLLGDLWREGSPAWNKALLADPGVHLHLYGKQKPAVGRKMGHLTVLDRDPDQALARAIAARSRLAPS